MFQTTLKEEIEKNEKRLEEEKALFEKLNTDVDSYLKELGITKEQLRILMQSSERFTEENWSQMKEMEEKLDRKLDASLGAIKDPRKSEKSQSSIKDVQRHWLFVR